MIKAVLFDMDGLMLDTERLAVDGWIKAGKLLGYPITFEIALQTRGTIIPKSREYYRNLYGEGFDYDKARGVRNDHVADWIAEHGVPAKPGLLELLRALREKGIAACIATATVRPIAERYLREVGALEYFSGFVSGDEVKNGKPSPDIFLLAAQRMGVPPEQCLVLEDSPFGVEAACRAGCKPIMVPDLTQPDDELREKCAFVAETLADVIPLLDRL